MKFAFSANIRQRVTVALPIDLSTKMLTLFLQIVSTDINPDQSRLYKKIDSRFRNKGGVYSIKKIIMDQINE